MSNVYHLVRRGPPASLVKCLERLTAQAQAGKLTGIAFIALLEDRAFIADACGECRDRPEETRALVPSLDSKLGRLARL